MTSALLLIPRVSVYTDVSGVGEEAAMLLDSLEPQADDPPEDVVKVILKRENSLRLSQCNGRYARSTDQRKIIRIVLL